MSENTFNLPSEKCQSETKDVLQQIANKLGETTGALEYAINTANEAGTIASNKATDAENKIIDVENRFQTLTTQQQQDSEVVDARQGELSLGAKISKIESSVSDIVTKTSTWISVTDFGAKGDGITDDTIPLQNAFDFAFDNKLEIRIPQGVFITTKPLKLWASNTEYGNYVTKLVGCGKGVTKIIKQGNDVSNLNNHNVDSIIIIANVMYKNGGSYVTKNDSTIISYKGYIGDITLESSDHNNKNAYGIFSLGFYYFHLYQIDFQYVNTGIYTQTWNCYNKYQRLEFNRVIYGCEFAVTEIGGNSTMNFEDCHMNGVDGCCYSIFGKATFKNCSIDGGGGTHYKAVGYDKGLAGYQSGNITLIDCHHESPSIFANNYLYELAYSHITVINTSIETPYVNFTSESIMMKATKWSTITLMNGGIHYRGGATKTLGKIYSTDATSTLKLNNFFIDKEASLNYNHFVYSASERLPIVNRHLSDITGMSKSISYIPSGVPVEEHPKHELSFTDNRVKFNCINDFERLSSSVLMFGKKIDITNYSKICIQGSVEFTTGSGTGNVSYKVVLNKTLVADGTVSIGIPTTFDYALLPSGKMPSNYSSTDFTRYVDVTNIIGEYYVGIELGGFSINSDIKEVSLIQ